MQSHLKTKQEINVIFRNMNIKDTNWNKILINCNILVNIIPVLNNYTSN